MTRTHRRYEVELWIRDLDGGAPQGDILRFLYRDDAGEHWLRMDGDWLLVEGGLFEPHVFVYELPRDLELEGSVLEFDLEREAA